MNKARKVLSRHRDLEKENVKNCRHLPQHKNKTLVLESQKNRECINYKSKTSII